MHKQAVRAFFISAVMGFILGWASILAHAVELKSLGVQYDRFVGKTIMPEMPIWEAKEGMGVLFDVDLTHSFFWNNRVHALTDSGQYRLVGWEFSLGTSPWRSLDLFYHHHSQHILDGHHPEFKFAGVQNSVGFTWKIYERGDNGGR